MNEFKQIEKQLEEAKTRKKEYILSKLDGRKQTWLSDNTGIHPVKISNWINSLGELSAEELKKISESLKVRF